MNYNYVFQLLMLDLFVYRARHSEARIQQMLWKVDFSDIVFINTVCLMLASDLKFIFILTLIYLVLV